MPVQFKTFGFALTIGFRGYGNFDGKTQRVLYLEARLLLLKYMKTQMQIEFSADKNKTSGYNTLAHQHTEERQQNSKFGLKNTT